MKKRTGLINIISLILPTILFVGLLLTACRDQAPEPPGASATEEASVVQSTTTGAAEATQAVHLPVATSGEQEGPAVTAAAGEATATFTPTPTTPAPTITPTPTATPLPEWLLYDGPALSRQNMGLQVHIHREDLSVIMNSLRELNVGWVKVQVSWKIYQPAPDRFDDYRFEELDRLVAAAQENDLQVLLGVAKAPEWSRPTTERDGPPVDYGLFQSFMSALATRYEGRVAAYELWNEANLQREWTGMPLSAASLVELIRAGATGVRAADPQAILISGAPATTGVNDGVVAIDDRQYLRQMVASGVAEVVDAIGAHPYGWANPPDSSVHDGAPTTSSHNDHPSFFFADTLVDYRQILDDAGYDQVPIWATEFGWGSYDGLDREPLPGLAYMAEVSEPQQAVYTRRAFAMAQQMPGIGPLILWNLNFAPTLGSEFAESSYSVLRPDGTKRPVFEALSTAPRQ